MLNPEIVLEPIVRGVQGLLTLGFSVGLWRKLQV